MQKSNHGMLWPNSGPFKLLYCNKYEKRFSSYVAIPLQKSALTWTQIHLRPFWRCLGNSQSGVQVVRKTALNYSERENFTAARGHCRPNICSAER